MTRNLSVLSLIPILAVLTFAIPAMQWLVGTFVSLSPYSGLISSISIILCIFLWYRRTKAFSLLPSSSAWKVFCYFVGAIVLALLIINIQNEPVSKITGQPRSPFEVVNVIILVPITEELIFRGVIWSIFERLCESDRWIVVLPLVGTSLLFGIEHLGYWLQSNWLLPPEAIVHILSMVVAGACFGAFRLVSGSVVVSMVIHMLANGIILLTQ